MAYHYKPSPQKMKQLQQPQDQQNTNPNVQSSPTSAAVQIPNSSVANNQNSYSNYKYMYKQQQLQQHQQQLQQQNQQNGSFKSSGSHSHHMSSSVGSISQQQQPHHQHHHHAEDNHHHTLIHKAPKNKVTKFKVSYTVGNVVGDKHCFGINTLAYDNESNQLYSGGRDSTVKLWSINHDKSFANYKMSFEGHNDWVNDMFINTKQSILVTGSSDTSIKVWDINSGECKRTERRHEDYVKALAYAPHSNFFASSGLDSHIVLWDLNIFSPVTKIPSSKIGTEEEHTSMLSSSISSSSSSIAAGMYTPQFNIARAGGDNLSIYSLAINNEASLVLAGSTERTIRAWDVTGGKKIFKLKGHTDNVRSIIISSDSRKCLSAGSDGSFRLWDLSLQKCIHSFDDIHTDSVWSLATTPNFSHVFSGGRDGLIYSTDLKTFQSTLICKETSPVLKIVHDDSHRSLWVSTTESSIKSWSIDVPINNKESVVTVEPRFIDEDREEDQQGAMFTGNEPIVTIPGRAGIIKHHIMHNRRHVLTKDTDDSVQLWDITKGEELQSFGKVDFDKQIEELQETISIPKWLTVDTKTGNINVTLEPPHCFSADVHLSNLGFNLQDGDEDTLYNVGERMLATLFSHWLKERQNCLNQLNSNSSVNSNNHVNSNNSSNVRSSQDDIDDDQQTHNCGKSCSDCRSDSSLAKKSSVKSPNTSSTPKMTANSNNSSATTAAPVEKSVKKMIFDLPKNTSIVIFDENNPNTSFRFKLDGFTGMESTDVIPEWVNSCIVDGKLQRKEPQSIQVALVPSDDKNISPTKSRFNIPNCTQLKKFSPHIVNSLNIFDSKIYQADEYIEYLVNGKVIPSKYTCATVRTFYWKSSDEMVLQYRVKLAYGNENDLKRLAKSNQLKKIIRNNNTNNNSNSNNSSSVNTSPSLFGQQTNNNHSEMNGTKSSPTNINSNGNSSSNRKPDLPPSLSISSSHVLIK